MGAQFCKCLDTPSTYSEPPLSPKTPLNGYTPPPDSKRRPEPVIGKRINLEDQFDSAASSGGQLLVKGTAAASSGGGGGGKEYYDGPRVGTREVHTGPRGGKYYINDAGKKMYLKAHQKTYFE